MTQAAVAGMATDADAAALLVYRAAWTKDTGAARVTREAAMAKWFATEAAGRICDRAVQLFGGRGVTRGETVERLYRDVRALRIYEGSSEIQQQIIAKQMLATAPAHVKRTGHVDRFAEEQSAAGRSDAGVALHAARNAVSGDDQRGGVAARSERGAR